MNLRRLALVGSLVVLSALLGVVVAYGAAWAGRSRPPASADPSPWGAGYFPNVPLVTHEGKTVRFYDDLIKGKVVAINFIFTVCSASCPLETARLREVQRLLGDRVGKDVFLYSISIDPLNDTPQALKAYAEKFGIGPGWLFLTGKEQDITLLRQRLGVYLPGLPSDDHSLSLVIGNQATGRWMKSSPFENPYVLATQLGTWLHNGRVTDARHADSYANAPEIRQISRGEELFRTRCSACHTLGDAEGALGVLRRLGPDLEGVTRRRDRAWLERWLKEPDRMLREKDPTALALLAQYNNLPMPNLGLEAVEIHALIDFMAERSGKSAASRPVKAGP